MGEKVRLRHPLELLPFANRCPFQMLNPETMTKAKEKEIFKEFMEDFNTGTINEKYANLEAWEKKQNAIRNGETVAADAGYDPRADLEAVRSKSKRAPVETATFLDEAQLQDLRRIQSERVELERMKRLGMSYVCPRCALLLKALLTVRCGFAVYPRALVSGLRTGSNPFFKAPDLGRAYAAARRVATRLRLARTRPYPIASGSLATCTCSAFYTPVLLWSASAFGDWRG